jgi:hypothetical protein
MIGVQTGIVPGWISYLMEKGPAGYQTNLHIDSDFTTYQKLSALNQQGVRFITIRRRGKDMTDKIGALDTWQRIHIPRAKRKYHNPLVHEALITLRDYEGDLRQLILRGNGREKLRFT